MSGYTEHVMRELLAILAAEPDRGRRLAPLLADAWDVGELTGLHQGLNGPLSSPPPPNPFRNWHLTGLLDE